MNHLTKKQMTQLRNKLIPADNLKTVSIWPSNHIDAIVTDPPYELGFMGKSWDSSGIAYSVSLWKQLLRITKPGGFLLCFGGTRKYHRVTCAIEDAGWEIRDCMSWIYGSGFPKSHNISKAIDKAAGAKRKVISEQPAYGIGGVGKNRSGRFGGHSEGATAKITAPTTSLAQLWDGYGTALKPAWEPIIVAMKPLNGTFAHNAEVHGVAGLNINAARIGTEQIKNQAKKGMHGCGSTEKMREQGFRPYKVDNRDCPESTHQGRWPANLILEKICIQVLTLMDNYDIISIEQRRIIEEYYATYELPTMWERVSDLSLSDKKQEGKVLHKGMLQQISERESSKANVGQETHQESPKENESPERSKQKISGVALQPGLQTNQSGGVVLRSAENSKTNDKQDFNTGTSDNNGNEVRQTFTPKRDCPPQEWNKRRQQDQKLGDNEQYQSYTSASQTNKRSDNVESKKREVAILITDIPEKWLKYFQLTGISLVDPDSSAAMLDEQTGTRKSGFMSAGTKRQMSDNPNKNTYGDYKPDTVRNDTYGDSGGASRFFYCAKCSKKERNMGLEDQSGKKVNDGRQTPIDNPYQRGETVRTNTHPTVKPLALIKYLCTLLKMPGQNQVILDPFMGSGTTGMACTELSIDFIGIDQSLEYCQIARKRINAIKKQKTLDFPPQVM